MMPERGLISKIPLSIRRIGRGVRYSSLKDKYNYQRQQKDDCEEINNLRGRADILHNTDNRCERKVNNKKGDRGGDKGDEAKNSTFHKIKCRKRSYENNGSDAVRCTERDSEEHKNQVGNTNNERSLEVKNKTQEINDSKSNVVKDKCLVENEQALVNHEDSCLRSKIEERNTNRNKIKDSHRHKDGTKYNTKEISSNSKESNERNKYKSVERQQADVDRHSKTCKVNGRTDKDKSSERGRKMKEHVEGKKENGDTERDNENNGTYLVKENVQMKEHDIEVIGEQNNGRYRDKEEVEENNGIYYDREKEKISQMKRDKRSNNRDLVRSKGNYLRDKDEETVQGVKKERNVLVKNKEITVEYKNNNVKTLERKDKEKQMSLERSEDFKVAKKGVTFEDIESKDDFLKKKIIIKEKFHSENETGYNINKKIIIKEQFHSENETGFNTKKTAESEDTPYIINTFPRINYEKSVNNEKVKEDQSPVINNNTKIKNKMNPNNRNNIRMKKTENYDPIATNKTTIENKITNINSNKHFKDNICVKQIIGKIEAKVDNTRFYSKSVLLEERQHEKKNVDEGKIKMFDETGSHLVKTKMKDFTKKNISLNLTNRDYEENLNELENSDEQVYKIDQNSSYNLQNHDFLEVFDKFENSSEYILKPGDNTPNTLENKKDLNRLENNSKSDENAPQSEEDLNKLITKIEEDPSTTFLNLDYGEQTKENINVYINDDIIKSHSKIDDTLQNIEDLEDWEKMDSCYTRKHLEDSDDISKYPRTKDSKDKKLEVILPPRREKDLLAAKRKRRSYEKSRSLKKYSLDSLSETTLEDRERAMIIKIADVFQPENFKLNTQKESNSEESAKVSKKCDLMKNDPFEENLNEHQTNPEISYLHSKKEKTGLKITKSTDFNSLNEFELKENLSQIYTLLHSQSLLKSGNEELTVDQVSFEDISSGSHLNENKISNDVKNQFKIKEQLSNDSFSPKAITKPQSSNTEVSATTQLQEELFCNISTVQLSNNQEYSSRAELTENVEDCENISNAEEVFELSENQVNYNVSSSAQLKENLTNLRYQKSHQGKVGNESTYIENSLNTLYTENEQSEISLETQLYSPNDQLTEDYEVSFEHFSPEDIHLRDQINDEDCNLKENQSSFSEGEIQLPQNVINYEDVSSKLDVNWMNDVFSNDEQSTSSLHEFNVSNKSKILEENDTDFVCGYENKDTHTGNEEYNINLSKMEDEAISEEEKIDNILTHEENSLTIFENEPNNFGVSEKTVNNTTKNHDLEEFQKRVSDFGTDHGTLQNEDSMKGQQEMEDNSCKNIEYDEKMEHHNEDNTIGIDSYSEEERKLRQKRLLAKINYCFGKYSKRVLENDLDESSGNYNKDENDDTLVNHGKVEMKCNNFGIANDSTNSKELDNNNTVGGFINIDQKVTIEKLENLEKVEQREKKIVKGDSTYFNGNVETSINAKSETRKRNFKSENTADGAGTDKLNSEAKRRRKKGPNKCIKRTQEMSDIFSKLEHSKKIDQTKQSKKLDKNQESNKIEKVKSQQVGDSNKSEDLFKILRELRNSNKSEDILHTLGVSNFTSDFKDIMHAFEKIKNFNNSKDFPELKEVFEKCGVSNYITNLEQIGNILGLSETSADFDICKTNSSIEETQNILKHADFTKPGNNKERNKILQTNKKPDLFKNIANTKCINEPLNNIEEKKITTKAEHYNSSDHPQKISGKSKLQKNPKDKKTELHNSSVNPETLEEFFHKHTPSNNGRNNKYNHKIEISEGNDISKIDGTEKSFASLRKTLKILNPEEIKKLFADAGDVFNSEEVGKILGVPGNYITSEEINTILEHKNNCFVKYENDLLKFFDKLKDFENSCVKSAGLINNMVLSTLKNDEQQCFISDNIGKNNDQSVEDCKIEDKAKKICYNSQNEDQTKIDSFRSINENNAKKGSFNNSKDREKIECYNNNREENENQMEQQRFCSNNYKENKFEETHSDYISYEFSQRVAEGVLFNFLDDVRNNVLWGEFEDNFHRTEFCDALEEKVLTWLSAHFLPSATTQPFLDDFFNNTNQPGLLINSIQTDMKRSLSNVSKISSNPSLTSSVQVNKGVDVFFFNQNDTLTNSQFNFSMKFDQPTKENNTTFKNKHFDKINNEKNDQLRNEGNAVYYEKEDVYLEDRKETQCKDEYIVNKVGICINTQLNDENKIKLEKYLENAERLEIDKGKTRSKFKNRQCATLNKEKSSLFKLYQGENFHRSISSKFTCEDDDNKNAKIKSCSEHDEYNGSIENESICGRGEENHQMRFYKDYINFDEGSICNTARSCENVYNYNYNNQFRASDENNLKPCDKEGVNPKTCDEGNCYFYKKLSYDKGTYYNPPKPNYDGNVYQYQKENVHQSFSNSVENADYNQLPEFYNKENVNYYQPKFDDKENLLRSRIKDNVNYNQTTSYDKDNIRYNQTRFCDKENINVKQSRFCENVSGEEEYISSTLTSSTSKLRSSKMREVDGMRCYNKNGTRDDLRFYEVERSARRNVQFSDDCRFLEGDGFYHSTKRRSKKWKKNTVKKLKGRHFTAVLSLKSSKPKKTDGFKRVIIVETNYDLKERVVKMLQNVREFLGEDDNEERTVTCEPFHRSNFDEMPRDKEYGYIDADRSGYDRLHEYGISEENTVEGGDCVEKSEDEKRKVDHYPKKEKMQIKTLEGLLQLLLSVRQRREGDSKPGRNRRDNNNSKFETNYENSDAVRIGMDEGTGRRVSYRLKKKEVKTLEDLLEVLGSDSGNIVKDCEINNLEVNSYDQNDQIRVVECNYRRDNTNFITNESSDRNYEDYIISGENKYNKTKADIAKDEGNNACEYRRVENIGKSNACQANRYDDIGKQGDSIAEIAEDINRNNGYNARGNKDTEIRMEEISRHDGSNAKRIKNIERRLNNKTREVNNLSSRRARLDLNRTTTDESSSCNSSKEKSYPSQENEVKHIIIEGHSLSQNMIESNHIIVKQSPKEKDNMNNNNKFGYFYTDIKNNSNWIYNHPEYNQMYSGYNTSPIIYQLPTTSKVNPEICRSTANSEMNELSGLMSTTNHLGKTLGEYAVSNTTNCYVQQKSENFNTPNCHVQQNSGNKDTFHYTILNKEKSETLENENGYFHVLKQVFKQEDSDIEYDSPGFQCPQGCYKIDVKTKVDREKKKAPEIYKTENRPNFAKHVQFMKTKLGYSVPEVLKRNHKNKKSAHKYNLERNELSCNSVEAKYINTYETGCTSLNADAFKINPQSEVNSNYVDSRLSKSLRNELNRNYYNSRNEACLNNYRPQEINTSSDFKKSKIINDNLKIPSNYMENNLRNFQETSGYSISPDSDFLSELNSNEKAAILKMNNADKSSCFMLPNGDVFRKNSENCFVCVPASESKNLFNTNNSFYATPNIGQNFKNVKPSVEVQRKLRRFNGRDTFEKLSDLSNNTSFKFNKRRYLYKEVIPEENMESFPEIKMEDFK